MVKQVWYTVADPGFPVGGVCTRWGGMDLRCGYFLVKMYAKMKELGPIGGACARHAPQIHQWYIACRLLKDWIKNVNNLAFYKHTGDL